ncbi:GntR family transcriptional regulator [Thauera linaloolentis]|nr:GntR family transcriptional regulator [Thauera linaloolentis]MCM8567661.1 GntR family transcriptional regulator [Thauera linaloolentis]
MPDADGLLLADKAFLALRELLAGGGLRAGQFVSMPDLVKSIGLPIAPVREAVKRAESAALVRVLPKRGVAVMEATPELIRECFHLRTIFDQEGARQLVRAGGRLDALRALHQRVLDAARDGITSSLQREAMAVDWALHSALADALDNDSAREIYARNRDRISVIQHSRPLLPDRIVPAMEEHLAIIDTIAAGEEERAATAVRDHFRQTLRWWGIIV